MARLADAGESVDGSAHRVGCLKFDAPALDPPAEPQSAFNSRSANQSVLGESW